MNKPVKITKKGFSQIFKETFSINATNPHGRASRREFWFFYIALNVVLLLLLLFYIAVSTFLKPSFNVKFIVFTPFFVLLLSSIVPMLCLAIRRLHDIKLSYIFILLYLIPNICLIYFMFFVRPSPSHIIMHFGITYILPYKMFYTIANILKATVFYMNIGLTIILFLKAGTKGPNKHGPQPL